MEHTRESAFRIPLIPRQIASSDEYVVHVRGYIYILAREKIGVSVTG